MKYLVSLERYDGDDDERPRRMFMTAKEAREWVNKMEGVYAATLYVLTKRGEFRKVDVWDEGWCSQRKIRIPKSDDTKSTIEKMGELTPRSWMEQWWNDIAQNTPSLSGMAALGGGAFGKPKEEEWPDVIDG